LTLEIVFNFLEQKTITITLIIHNERTNFNYKLFIKWTNKIE